MTTLTCRASAFSFSNNLRTASSAPTDGSIGVVRTLFFQTLRFSFVATRSVNVPPMSIATLTVFPATISFPCLLTNLARFLLCSRFDRVTFGYLQLLISFQFIEHAGCLQ